MSLERHHDLTPALLEEILGLVDAAGEGDASALGEAKRVQLTPGAQAWSGVLARDGGALVGYAHVRWGQGDPEPRATAEVVVAPDARDRSATARELIGEVRRLLADAGGGTLNVWAHEVADASAGLPAAAGLGVQRELAVMERPLEAPPEVGEAPEGVELRAYRPGDDDAELLRVNNAAFAGHPEQGGWDASTLAERRERPWFDPSGLILAWRDGRLLAFHWTKVHDGDVPPTGEVYVLGAAPDARGLGLGGVLLRAGLAHLHGRGCRRAILYVDNANASAVRLYEREGFETRHLEVCYEDVVSPS